GAFGAAMAELGARRLLAPLRARIGSGGPVLAICLGMQLLFESSEESPRVAGLGVIPGAVRRLPAHARVPHMGWNHVQPIDDRGSLRPGFAYFANSFASLSIPEGWRGATTRHGGTFASAIERGRVLACQFHPELSGRYGGALLQRWIAGASEPSTC